jgi:hypothetical protein
MLGGQVAGYGRPRQARLEKKGQREEGRSVCREAFEEKAVKKVHFQTGGFNAIPFRR